ncbi:MAG: SCP2 sterol-binding domain-containing protein [Thermoplasmata archaeon]|nr:SCP2 sterol-binding domain-containing protein [Thermoplasmata archaeon]
MIEQIFNQIIQKFNEKASRDARMRAELEGVERKIQIELDDGRIYSTLLKDCKLTQLSKGGVENPDLRIISSETTVKQLWNREIGPWKAMVTGKLKIIGSLEDKVRLRKLLGD